MILKKFTIFDSAVGLFIEPFYRISVGQALREFEDSVANPEHQMHKHAADYTLFELGEFDQASAKETPLTAKLRIEDALSVKTRLETQGTPRYGEHGEDTE